MPRVPLRTDPPITGCPDLFLISVNPCKSVVGFCLSDLPITRDHPITRFSPYSFRALSLVFS